MSVPSVEDTATWAAGVAIATIMSHLIPYEFLADGVDIGVFAACILVIDHDLGLVITPLFQPAHKCLSDRIQGRMLHILDQADLIGLSFPSFPVLSWKVKWETTEEVTPLEQACQKADAQAPGRELVNTVFSSRFVLSV